MATGRQDLTSMTPASEPPGAVAARLRPSRTWRWGRAARRWPVRWLAAGLLGAALSSVAAAVLVLGQRRVRVRGVSMQPLLRDGERVLVDRLAYRWRRPKRGDVVLLRGLPGAGPELLLKRVVGLPGETVAVARDRLLIDGRPLELGRPVVGSSPGAWRLGPDGYFMLSENLALGTDSRHVGPVRRADLLGRAWLVYAPAVRRLTAPPAR